MCQRRYQVCAPRLRGGTINCRVIAILWALLKIRELNFRGPRPIREKSEAPRKFGAIRYEQEVIYGTTYDTNVDIEN